jgi:uncharacterized membrane protein (Fun14 family)
MFGIEVAPCTTVDIVMSLGIGAVIGIVIGIVLRSMQYVARNRKGRS